MKATPTKRTLGGRGDVRPGAARAWMNTDALVLSRRGSPDDRVAEQGTKTFAGAGVGALVGAVLCATVGILASVGTLRSAWLEPFVTVGPLYSALNGSAIGATFGAFFGALAGLRVPRVSARVATTKSATAGAVAAGGPVAPTSDGGLARRALVRRSRAVSLHDARVSRAARG